MLAPVHIRRSATPPELKSVHVAPLLELRSQRAITKRAFEAWTRVVAAGSWLITSTARLSRRHHLIYLCTFSNPPRCPSTHPCRLPCLPTAPSRRPCPSPSHPLSMP